VSGVTAIVLAAGQGTRFGSEPKMLAHLRGKPLVRHVAEAAVASSLRPCIVVTGHRAAEVERALRDLPLLVVFNAAYAGGLSTSLKAGFAALPPETEAGLVLLGDMPLVAPSLIDHLAKAWVEKGRPAALVPVANGRRGNPVVLSRRLAPEIAALEGDVGAGLLLRCRTDVVEWPVEDPAVLYDVDTAEALAGREAG
jgi:molybdenum cofactor cytidylyltransferase